MDTGCTPPSQSLRSRVISHDITSQLNKNGWRHKVRARKRVRVTALDLLSSGMHFKEFRRIKVPRVYVIATRVPKTAARPCHSRFMFWGVGILFHPVLTWLEERRRRL